MKFIGIVDELKPEHTPGIYAREEYVQSNTSKDAEVDADFLKDTKQTEKISDSDWQSYLSSIPAITQVSRSFGVWGVLGGFVASAIGIVIQKKSVKNSQREKNDLILQSAFEDDSVKALYFHDKGMCNNYRIDQGLLYGLFDKNRSSKRALKTLLNSKGGSDLIIMDKETAKQFKHLSNGHFSSGLHILHPKNNKILIPLVNSTKLVEALILEETVRAYEALGAKEIIIVDTTDSNLKGGFSKKDLGGELELGKKDVYLRKIRFGKGVFDPERAIQNKYFIQDIPRIMTTIESRKHGNQLEESFSERISLNLNLDLDVLRLFNAKAKMSSFRQWYFKVEFYDKNDL